MKITLKGYITCKEAENPSDCADNYAYNQETFRFAISDGVTKSFFPNIWSKILVESFVALEGATELSIIDCQDKWLKQVDEKANAPEAKWFTKNAYNRQESGMATFVSLRFDNGKWFAKALGDSYLFFIPRGKEESFDNWVRFSSKNEMPPVFDNYPDYFSSRGKDHHGEAKLYEDSLESGTFYLMTDALAEWVFKEKEKALSEMQKMWNNQSEFELSINGLRKLQKLNNDDSSVLIIEIEDDGRSGFEHHCEPPVCVTKISDLIEKEVKREVKKETFTGEISRDSKKMETDTKVTFVSEEENDGIEDANIVVESEEKEVEFSKLEQDTFDKCVKICNNALRELKTAINGSRNTPHTKKLLENEKKRVIEKLLKHVFFLLEQKIINGKN